MIDDLVDEVLAKARLTRATRARVRGELRAHVEDALAAGRSLDEVRESLGDAEVLSLALELAPPPARRSPAVIAALAATTAMLAWYGATAVRLGSFATTPTVNPVLDSTASVAQLWMAADSALRRANVTSAIEIAERLSASGSAFGETAAIRVAQRALPLVAAKPCGWQRQRVVALASAPVPDLDAWYRDAISRSGGSRLGRALRLVQAMKGVRSPSLVARLLEPLYFATAADPGDLLPLPWAKAERHTEPSRCAAP